MYGELEPLKTAKGDDFPAFPIEIRHPHKTAALRLPTSQEISTYTATIRQVVRRIGRRQSEDQDIPNTKAERALFDAIRLDKSGEEFDDHEARYAINLILRHEVTGCEQNGNQFIVKIATVFGSTVHTCRMPTTREVQTYREGVIKSRDLPHSAEERRFPPEVPVNFYDAIIVAVEGYAPQLNVPVGTVNGNRHVLEDQELKAILPQIPPHHKRSVAGEVSLALYDLDPQLDDPST